MERKHILDRVLGTQHNTNNMISGSYFSYNSIENESVLTNPKDIKEYKHVLNYLDFSHLKQKLKAH